MVRQDTEGSSTLERNPESGSVEASKASHRSWEEIQHKIETSQQGHAYKHLCWKSVIVAHHKPRVLTALTGSGKLMVALPLMSNAALRCPLEARQVQSERSVGNPPETELHHWCLIS